MDTLILVITAGHETTVNLLDQAVTALLTHPGQLRQVLGGKRTWSDVVDETLRWQAPLSHLPLRFAREDIEVEGTVIHAGDPILPSFGPAGRDESHHGPDAHEFDLTRKDKSALAFGHGVHYCLGAQLARMEAELGFLNVVRAVPGSGAGGGRGGAGAGAVVHHQRARDVAGAVAVLVSAAAG